MSKEPVSPANPPRPHCITAQLKTKARKTQAFILFLVCGSENELRNSKQIKTHTHRWFGASIWPCEFFSVQNHFPYHIDVS